MLLHLHPEDLRRIAHAAVLHWQRMKKLEGALPPSEAALLALAQQIEGSYSLSALRIESLGKQVS